MPEKNETKIIIKNKTKQNKNKTKTKNTEMGIKADFSS